MKDKVLIEKIEYELFTEIYDFIVSDYENEFIDQELLLSNTDLINYLSGQGSGRATCYKTEIESLISNIDKISSNQKKELNMRLASLNLFSEAIEKYLYDKIGDYLSQNVENYYIWPSPNAADISYILPDYHDRYGVILHIDAKSIAGLKNLGDSLKNGKIGKFEINWNQLSYFPPLLRERVKDKSLYYQKKHIPLKTKRVIDGRLYYTITFFFQHISFINAKTFDIETFKSMDIDGSSFDNIAYLICVPNGELQSNYYDGLFQKGKAGYDHGDSDTGIPKDCRFACFDNDGDYASFINKNEKPRFKIVYTPNGVRKKSNQEVEAIVAKGNNLKTKKFNIQFPYFES